MKWILYIQIHYLPVQRLLPLALQLSHSKYISQCTHNLTQSLILNAFDNLSFYRFEVKSNQLNLRDRNLNICWMINSNCCEIYNLDTDQHLKRIFRGKLTCKHFKGYLHMYKGRGNEPLLIQTFGCFHVCDLLLQQPPEQSQRWAGPRCSVFSPFRMSQPWSRAPIGSCLQTRHNHD